MTKVGENGRWVTGQGKTVRGSHVTKGVTLIYMMNTPDGPVRLPVLIHLAHRHPARPGGYLRVKGFSPGHPTMKPIKIVDWIPTNADLTIWEDWPDELI